jgi:thioredoxin reductase
LIYDCVIVGAGIAGLQAAIQLGRYTAYRILAVDKGTGRSTLCRSYHNLLGWPEGISGEELRRRGRDQAGQYGVQFVQDEIVRAEKQAERFLLTGSSGNTYLAKTLLLCTGVTDRMPPIPGLIPTLGRTVYICPDCDGYEVRNRKTVVIGAGDAGASMALTLSARTSDLLYVNHDKAAVSPQQMSRLQAKGIGYEAAAVREVATSGDGLIAGVVLEDGRRIPAERGFVAFGGNKVHSELAAQLGVRVEENGHVATDPRTKMTSVANVWVAGDLGLHSEQVTVAMGEGSLAAIWIHKTLQRYI